MVQVSANSSIFSIYMKYRINIPALLLAVLFLVASNGIAVFEHICNSSNTHHYYFFSKVACEMDKPLAPCCAQKIAPIKKNCCADKQFFSKLSVEGFTAKSFILKQVERYYVFACIVYPTHLIDKRLTEYYYCGLAPPGNMFTIQSFLQPKHSRLQIFLC